MNTRGRKRLVFPEPEDLPERQRYSVERDPLGYLIVNRLALGRAYEPLMEAMRDSSMGLIQFHKELAEPKGGAVGLFAGIGPSSVARIRKVFGVREGMFPPEW